MGDDTPVTDLKDKGTEALGDRSHKLIIELVPNTVVEVSEAEGIASNATEMEV